MTPKAVHPVAVLVAKLPRPGTVKTRLISAHIDESAAAAIALALARCTAKRLQARFQVHLAVTPDDCGAEFLDLLGLRLPVIPQGRGDLGERLAAAWQAVGAATPVAFFGIDAPDVPAAALDAVESSLAMHDALIGPTADGGYWTLAARTPQPRLLRDIAWGKAGVAAQTRARAAEAGVRLGELPAWYDVDTVDDLRALRARLAAAVSAPTTGPHDRAAMAELAAALDKRAIGDGCLSPA
jgi:uncharacterized protein